jgi:hypothetical protein
VVPAEAGRRIGCTPGFFHSRGKWNSVSTGVNMGPEEVALERVEAGVESAVVKGVFGSDVRPRCERRSRWAVVRESH